MLMQFAHGGEGIATGSKDGTVRVILPALLRPPTLLLPVK
jgi:hypothetical protein